MTAFSFALHLSTPSPSLEISISSSVTPKFLRLVKCFLCRCAVRVWEIHKRLRKAEETWKRYEKVVENTDKNKSPSRSVISRRNAASDLFQFTSLASGGVEKDVAELEKKSINSLYLFSVLLLSRLDIRLIAAQGTRQVIVNYLQLWRIVFESETRLCSCESAKSMRWLLSESSKWDCLGLLKTRASSRF